jgi:hypothetical protein
MTSPFKEIISLTTFKAILLRRTGFTEWIYGLLFMGK